MEYRTRLLMNVGLSYTILKQPKRKARQVSYPNVEMEVDREKLAGLGTENLVFISATLTRPRQGSQETWELAQNSPSSSTSSHDGACLPLFGGVREPMNGSLFGVC